MFPAHVKLQQQNQKMTLVMVSHARACRLNLNDVVPEPHAQGFRTKGYRYLSDLTDIERGAVIDDILFKKGGHAIYSVHSRHA